MTAPFLYDVKPQRVVFSAGAVAKVAEEAARLGIARALVVATPGSGARLGQSIVGLLGDRAAGLHAQAVMHVPVAVANAGIAAARAAKADGLVAAGGGSAIGLAKAIAHETGLPIVAIPTTYSGSETTSIFGLSEGERKTVSRSERVFARTIIYDPELTLDLPPKVTAASAMNAAAHCVEALWAAEATPATSAMAIEALRLFDAALPRAVADGRDLAARGDCLAAAWLAGCSLAAGSGLQHKLAHVLGGLGLPHAETHAIILPHVTRFNASATPEIHARLSAAFGGREPAEAVAALLQRLPIPQRLRDVGFDRGKVETAAELVDALKIAAPRPARAGDLRALLAAAY